MVELSRHGVSVVCKGRVLAELSGSLQTVWSRIVGLPTSVASPAPLSSCEPKSRLMPPLMPSTRPAMSSAQRSTGALHDPAWGVQTKVKSSKHQSRGCARVRVVRYVAGEVRLNVQRKRTNVRGRSHCRCAEIEGLSICANTINITLATSRVDFG
jgi:hypothetical protein